MTLNENIKQSGIKLEQSAIYCFVSAETPVLLHALWPKVYGHQNITPQSNVQHAALTALTLLWSSFHEVLEAGCRNWLPFGNKSVRWGRPLMLADKFWVLSQNHWMGFRLLFCAGQFISSKTWKANQTRRTISWFLCTGWFMKQETAFLNLLLESWKHTVVC